MTPFQPLPYGFNADPFAHICGDGWTTKCGRVVSERSNMPAPSQPMCPTCLRRDEEDVLAKVIEMDQERGHVSPDTCGRCGGLGCDECRYCPCDRKDCRRRRRAAT